MPRKKGGLERMEQEKKKRQSGQNGRDSVEWKSEARWSFGQQYDRPTEVRGVRLAPSIERWEGVTGYCVC